MKKAIFILISIAVLGAGVGVFLYFKPVKNLAKTKADVTAQSMSEIQSLFLDIKSNTASYIGKIIEISGVVSDIDILPEGGGYLLMDYDEESILINAQLDHRITESKVNVRDSCVIRAEFTGMEEDLIDPTLHILYFKQTAIVKP